MASEARSIAVTLTGGGPWGFRLRGGRGTGTPLTVLKVRAPRFAHREGWSGMHRPAPSAAAAGPPSGALSDWAAGIGVVTFAKSGRRAERKIAEN